MNKWQAIVFDLDDTLYPESEYVLSGFQAVAEWAQSTFKIAANLGFNYLSMLFQQGARGDTFNQWLTHFNLIDAASDPDDVKALINQMVEVYRTHAPTLRPFAEVMAYLPTFQQHYRLGLVSDGYLAVQRRKLAALKLERYLHAVVFSDQWGRAAWKPSTIPFTAVLKGLHVAPAQAVYVADNPLKDFYGPRQLGMSTIWLKHAQGDYTQHQPPTTAHAPDTVCRTWTELNHFMRVHSSPSACLV